MGGLTATADDYAIVDALDERAMEAGRRAAELLSARPCPAGRLSVILDPELAAVLVHEAFGHTVEADTFVDDSEMGKLVALGTRIGPTELTIVDDGTVAGLSSGGAFDDEGTPTGKTTIVQSGHVAGHLHSRETAARMGARPTGNARSARRNAPPLVRMTHTYIDRGSQRVGDLFRGVDHGVYAIGSTGGESTAGSYTFSANYGYLIEGGHRTELLRDVVFRGNVFEGFRQLDGISDDLQLFEGGLCGKGDQRGLPVSAGSPHLRIRDLQIGGTV